MLWGARDFVDRFSRRSSASFSECGYILETGCSHRMSCCSALGARPSARQGSEGTDPVLCRQPPRSERRHRQSRKARGYSVRSEEHTSELQSLMRISYAVFCLKKKKRQKIVRYTTTYKAEK